MQGSSYSIAMHYIPYAIVHGITIAISGQVLLLFTSRFCTKSKEGQCNVIGPDQESRLQSLSSRRDIDSL